MKVNVRIIILFIFLLVGISCTYQRPLLSIRVSSRTIVDSVTHGTVKKNNYNYCGFSKLTSLGGYIRTDRFDSLGNKVEVRHWKKKPLYRHDGNVRYYTKIFNYKSSGKKEKVTKRIFQNQGVGGYVVLDKTIYFENGKKTQVGSQLKRKRNHLY